MLIRKKHTDIAIAGAGPCGLTLALLFRRQGLNIAIFEKDESSRSYSFALALHPAVQSLYRELGILGELEAHALPVEEVKLYDGHRPAASVSFAEISATHPGRVLVIPQIHLETVLLRALENTGSKVAWSHRVARFEADDNGVALEVDQLDERGVGYAIAHSERFVTRTHKFGAAYLIGADGHHSLVRRQLGIAFEETAPPLHYAVFECALDSPASPQARLVFENSRLNVFWPMPGNAARWAFQLDDTTIHSISRDKEHAYIIHGRTPMPLFDRTHFEEFLRSRVPWAPETPGRVRWAMPVRFESRLAPSFGHGRTWILGDAGHMTKPAGIQSMNVGLLEARDLAHSIVARINGKPCGTRQPGSLENFNPERSTEWKQLLSLERLPVAENDADPFIASRAGEILPSLPASGSVLTAAMAQLGFRLET